MKNLETSKKIRRVVTKPGLVLLLSSFLACTCVFASPLNDVSDTGLFFSRVLRIVESLFQWVKIPEASVPSSSEISDEGLTVALDAATQFSTVAPKGATNITFSCWNFSVGSTTHRIEALTVHRTGTGPDRDLSDLYLYEGYDRLTPGRSVNSETQTVEFKNMNISIEPGTIRRICLVGGFSPTAGVADQQAFGLFSSADITTDAPIVHGDFPQTGTLITIAG